MAASCPWAHEEGCASHKLSLSLRPFYRAPSLLPSSCWLALTFWRGRDKVFILIGRW